MTNIRAEAKTNPGGHRLDESSSSILIFFQISALFHDLRWFSTIFMIHLEVFNAFLEFSTIFLIFSRFLSIFVDFPSIMGTGGCRGVTRECRGEKHRFGEARSCICSQKSVPCRQWNMRGGGVHCRIWKAPNALLTFMVEYTNQACR